MERTVHDLKNPLAVVRASLEWLEVELAGREDALDAVRDASSAATRLLVIIDDLDALAHLEAGRAVLLEPLEIGDVLGQVTASAGARLGSRGMFVASISPVTVETRGDSQLVQRSLEALVDVCARGAPPGACVELAVRLPASASYIEIDIGLRGTVPNGPPVESIDGHASGGLGVYIAMKVAIAHGGTLLLVPTETVPRILVRLPR